MQRTLRCPRLFTSKIGVRYVQSMLSRNETGPTFSLQDTLPRLPVPPLQQTVNSLIKSCIPLSSAKMNEVIEITSDFSKEGGLGEELQTRLKEREMNEENWLEKIWLEYAYLKSREPILINSNWYCQFVNHPNQPHDLLSKPPPKGVLTEFQIERAAGLITNMLNYKEILENENIPIEYHKGNPLCMYQLKSLFGSSRVPGAEMDKLVKSEAFGTHIIVMLQDQLFKLNLYHKDGSRLPINDIQRQLFAIGRNCLETTPDQPIGILTAGYRDDWNKWYEHLKSLSPQNAENFKTIEESLFVLCLDDFSAKANENIAHLQFFHNFDAKNRWFDKPIQLIVASNGRAGVNGEHAPMDAVVPGNLFEYLLTNEPAKNPKSTATGNIPPPPERLSWITDNTIAKAVEKNQHIVRSLIKATESVIFRDDVYGARYIKEVAKCSPDSYIQMALQLTWARLHKRPTAVYETGSTRQFFHGRTETVRSLSEDSQEFVDSFEDDDILYEDKRRLFRKAIETHKTLMNDAMSGNGVDRHVLGLFAVAGPEEREHRIFRSRCIQRSQEWKLSTSNMSPGILFYGGFGPAHKDGYGVNYAIDEDAIRFSISCKKDSKARAYDFRDNLSQVLRDMMILFPKRTKIWGYDWKEKHRLEKKEKALMGQLTTISNQYWEKAEQLKRRNDL